MPYHQVRKGDYWVGDNQSRYYNNLRNSADGGFRWWLRSGVNESENLRAFGAQYRYVAVINFNRAPDAQQAYRGFGIFLLEKGEGTAAESASLESRGQVAALPGRGTRSHRR